MCCNTAGAVRALGAEVVRERDGDWRVKGAAWQMAEPGALDFGNSGTGSRLMMGAMATTPSRRSLPAMPSLRSRPMARVLEPLTQFGMRYEAQGPKALMPVTMHGARDAKAIDTKSPSHRRR